MAMKKDEKKRVKFNAMLTLEVPRGLKISPDLRADVVLMGLCREGFPGAVRGAALVQQKSAPAMQPFVIDMRHDESADPTYSARTTWEEALIVARKFWESYDGVYDEKAKKPWKAGEGHDQEVSVTQKKGSFLYLSHSGGEGPCIRIERAEK